MERKGKMNIKTSVNINITEEIFEEEEIMKLKIENCKIEGTMSGLFTIFTILTKEIRDKMIEKMPEEIVDVILGTTALHPPDLNKLSDKCCKSFLEKCLGE